MSRMTLVLLVVAAVATVVIVVLVIRRRRYISDLRARGWVFVSSPVLESVLDHQAPPFGLGFEREVDESISGTTTSGVRFHVFEYSCSGGGRPFDERVASLQLPLALPPLFVSHGPTRTGVHLPGAEIDPGWQVNAEGRDYVVAVLTGPVRDAVARFGATAGRIDLSIDGAQLVSVGAPRDPETLQAYLEALAVVVSALAVTELAPFAVPPAEARFGFFGRPDWTLVEREDSLIDTYGLTRQGSHHRTERVVRSPNDGLPLEAFVHRWQTTRTETYINTQGKVQTRRVTEHHDETVTAVWLPFSLPKLSINGGWGGRKVKFELEEFNNAYTVRTSDPKFASDVLHPRTMEYVMSAAPPGLEIEGQLVRFLPDEHDTLLIGRCADFVHELLARVPSFVWHDRGITPPRFRAAIDR